MNKTLTHRKALMGDLKTIIRLLHQDEFGQSREQLSKTIDQRYINAFQIIDADSNQYLMIVEYAKIIVATCHLTIMPSLTLIGSARMQIEAVRVDNQYRGQKIGQWMINAAIEYGQSNHVSLIQLMTDKRRIRAKKFYVDIGFKNTHDGMKLYVT